MESESAQKSNVESKLSPTVSDESEQKLLSPAESAGDYGTGGHVAQPSEDETTEERKDQSEYDMEYEKAQKEAKRYHEDMERNKREGFWAGIILGVSAVICIVLVALAVTTIVYGSLGLAGRDNCSYSNKAVSAFGITSGIVIIFLIVLMVLLMTLCYACTFSLGSGYSGMCKYLEIAIVIITVGIISTLAIIANYVFSFVSIVKEVYVGGPASNDTVANCTSPAFYTAFTYVTVEFIVLAVLIPVIVVGFVCCVYLRHKKSK